MPKRSKNDAKINMAVMCFFNVMCERLFLWKYVFSCRKTAVFRLWRIKKVAKTHENDVRNGCLRNVLKIDGFLTKTELQYVPKTMSKLRFVGYNVAPDFWHVLRHVLGRKWCQHGPNLAPRMAP